MPRAPVGPEEALLKQFLTDAIANQMGRKYRRLDDAAEALDENFEQLSRVRNGHCGELSIGWLMRVATKIGVSMKIHVTEPAVT